MDQALVLLSGGMDSAALLFHVRHRLGVRNVRALSFAYGQKHAREIESARWQAQAAGVTEHRVVDLTCMRDLIGNASALIGAGAAVPENEHLAREQRQQPPTYVPNRNLVFLSIGASWAESAGVGDLFYGAQAGDEVGYWDCTPDFVEQLNRLLGLNRGRMVRVHAPFVGKSKAAVLREGRELGVDFGHTWTCYRGSMTPCRTCSSCVSRATAFREAGLSDPLV